MKKTYLVILYVSLLAGLEFPDFDLHLLFFLGHRSILTHGIIVPFFLYKFLTMESYFKFSNKIFGRFFSNKNIWVKRPGTGEVPASDYEKLIGKKAIKSIKKDSHLSWKDFN